jgi:hypothetical protein
VASAWLQIRFGRPVACGRRGAPAAQHTPVGRAHWRDEQVAVQRLQDLLGPVKGQLGVFIGVGPQRSAAGGGVVWHRRVHGRGGAGQHEYQRQAATGFARHAGCPGAKGPGRWVKSARPLRQACSRPAPSAAPLPALTGASERTP